MYKAHKILLLSNRPPEQQASAQTLQEASYQVLEATSSEAGLDLLRHHRPHLVIIDGDWTGSNDAGAWRRLLRDTNLQPLAVLHIAGAESSLFADDDPYPAYCRVRAPLNKAELLARVDTLLQMVQSPVVSPRAQSKELARVQRKLARANLLLNQLEELTGMAYGEFDHGSGEFHQSQGWLRLCGLDSGPITMESLEQIAHPDDWPAVRQALEDHFRHQVPYDIEHRIIRQDTGEVRHLRALAETLYDDQGQPQKSYSVSLDITEAKRVQQALQASEHQHRMLVEFAGEGIGYYDLDGRVQMFNEVAAHRMGGRPEDFVGKTFTDLFGEELGAVYHERLRSAAQSPVALSYVDQVSLPTGTKHFSSRYTRITDPDGTVTGVMILSTDITGP